MMNDPENPIINTALDTSSVMRGYILLTLGIPLTFAPFGMLSAVGLFLFLIGIFKAYGARKKPDPIIHSHGRWMVRTIWMSSLLFIIAMALSSAVVTSNANNATIQNLAAVLKSGSATPDEIKAMILQFQTDNSALILWSTIICFLPPIVYSVLRLIKGYRLADAGKAVPEVTNWLI